MKFMQQFGAARRVSTPLVEVRTSDMASTVKAITAEQGTSVPMMYWDMIHGLVGLNDAGKAEVIRLLQGVAADKQATTNPVAFLQLIEKAGQNVTRGAGPIVFMANAQLVWKDIRVTQAIWNLRDFFKGRAAMLVLLTTGSTPLPLELNQDVMVFEEPLPTEAELEQIVVKTYEDFGKVQVPTDKSTPSMGRIVDALSGLAAFPAEQSLAMCLTKQGLDTDELWERKRKVIEQTAGLSIWRGGETFADIEGYEAAKRWGKRVTGAKKRIRGVVFLDEIEKAFAGTGTELSGVKTEMTGTFLSWMQDKGVRGSLLVGPPGSGKSLFGKAIGSEAGVPTIAFDFGGMQSGVVGSSGERLRQALKQVDAVTQGSALVIGTCNSLSSLPPELRRRFALGTFFFDLPTEAERRKIWRLYVEKFGLDGSQEKPEDTGYTGAEIFECCRKADDFGISLVDSAKYIVPVAISAADKIRELRQFANGRFLSASKDGVYIYDAEKVEMPNGARRILEGIDMMSAGATKVGQA